jgi:hypothetical protein
MDEPEPALTRLLGAAGAGDRATVAEILDTAVCDVNAVDGEGWSCLILASKVDLALWTAAMPCAVLLSTGPARAHVATPCMRMPALTSSLLLCRARGRAQAGDLNMVEYLLERGASPNPAGIAHTALRAASIFGHEEVARRLLAAQADPNFCSLHGRSPLMGAAMNKRPPLVQILLEAQVRSRLPALESPKHGMPHREDGTQLLQAGRTLKQFVTTRPTSRQRMTTARRLWILPSALIAQRLWICYDEQGLGHRIDLLRVSPSDCGLAGQEEGGLVPDLRLESRGCLHCRLYVGVHETKGASAALLHTPHTLVLHPEDSLPDRRFVRAYVQAFECRRAVSCPALSG